MLARMAVIYAAIEFPADGKEKFRHLHYSSYAVSATLKSGVKMEFLTQQNKFLFFYFFISYCLKYLVLQRLAK